MRIGIIADTHNDQNLTQRALARLQQESIGTILHAGDVTSARLLQLFEGYDVWIARGNMDHDPALIPTAQALFGPGRLKAVHTLSLNGCNIAMVHNGESPSARELIKTKAYTYLIHGHTHHIRDERMLSTRIINPGAIGNTRWRRPSFAILDLGTDDLSIIEL
ncbi:MAG: metallophosphoesterase family protein [Anaerolineae bacterium]|nr:metallophosphoesterase family protein [Anaerolineae bacterium]